jgi:hypothetical protein
MNLRKQTVKQQTGVITNMKTGKKEVPQRGRAGPLWGWVVNLLRPAKRTEASR